jgi:hypothetical protein
MRIQMPGSDPESTFSLWLHNHPAYPVYFFVIKDGTFDTAPPPFADGQIVFIHAKLATGRAMPAAFAILSRKVEKLDIRLYVLCRVVWG